LLAVGGAPIWRADFVLVWKVALRLQYFILGEIPLSLHPYIFQQWIYAKEKHIRALSLLYRTNAKNGCAYMRSWLDRPLRKFCRPYVATWVRFGKAHRMIAGRFALAVMPFLLLFQEYLPIFSMLESS